MHSISWVLNRRRRHLRLPPRWDPAPARATRVMNCAFGLQQSAVSRFASLPLRELDPLPRPRPARLLALDRTRIPGQQALFPQLLAVPLVGEAQRPRDRETQRARLTRLAPP